MQYEHKQIEDKWQQEWRKRGTYKVGEDPTKPKFYALDMFPYPSGAGLHVGHPLGYIASDIVARYKRHSGFNVLHPMGYDSFGLPAEQYAIQTGQHPAKTTEINLARYREQLDRIGFSFDWSREVRTSDPAYYKWTQWIFLQLFDSWYDHEQQKARPIAELVERFARQGWDASDPCVLTGDIEEDLDAFGAAEWNAFEERTQQRILQHFRLAYLSEAWVNWCPALGTVLANDEVKDGVSERGGHPVERKRMPQWSMRITAYAQRLLDGLDTLDWSASMKEAQRNWIGRSEGALVRFKLKDVPGTIDVFTTRPDTLYGVTFLTLAPEHELVEVITPAQQREEVMAYVTSAKNRSERDRMADVKTVSGVFTGSYATHPFTDEEVPIWVGDYVLAGYGTGAVMAVPGGDQRDWNFATHFGLPIIAVTEGADISKGADESKEGTICTEGFLKGLPVKEAIPRAIEELVKLGAGERRINFRLRDAAFGRQRYWGEPIPIYYKDGIPRALPESALPLELPAIDKFQPTETGEPPLARAERWAWDEADQQLTGSAIGFPIETTTMPGWAGSSWYFLRYMDPHNAERFASPESIAYWQQIDLYMGGSEHATGHLLYFRFWTKFLHDRGWLPFDEPAKKLVNQGMIQGVSAVATATKSTYNNRGGTLHPNIGWRLETKDGDTRQFLGSGDGMRYFLSSDLAQELVSGSFMDSDLEVFDFRFDVRYIENGRIDFGKVGVVENREDVKNGVFLTWDGYWEAGDFHEYLNAAESRIDPTRLDFTKRGVQDFTVRAEVEKMSKSKFNVVNPDDIIAKYGADTLRLYEMFLGPLEQSKPWDTNGIEGTFRFLRKFWNLFHQGDAGATNAQRASDAPVPSTPRVDNDGFLVVDDAPTKPELKTLHATLKKITEDIEKMSFNTSVAQFMIAANELGALKCNKRAVLEPLVIALAPFAPHIAEELWEKLGHADSVTGANWPQWDAQHLVEDNFSYPISFNGKTRLMLEFPIALSKEEVEAQVLANPEVQAKLEGKAPKKVIVVPKRIVNIVV
jgi:leucyl-tRNA synthetase